MNFPKPVSRSPEEILEIAFLRSRVVMMNETHSDLKPCIRANWTTHRTGQSSLDSLLNSFGLRLAVELEYGLYNGYYT
jgi:hypothetical protein